MGIRYPLHYNQQIIRHFILVKGITLLHNTVFLKYMDPLSKGKKPIQWSLHGRDRVYRREDIVNATNVWVEICHHSVISHNHKIQFIIV